MGDSIILVLDQLANSHIIAVDSKTGKKRWLVERSESHAWSTPVVFQPSGSVEPLVLTASSGQLAGHRISDGQRVFSHLGLPAGIIASPTLAGNTVFAFGYSLSEPPWADKLTQLDKNQDQRLSVDEYGTSSVLVAIAHYLGNRDGIVTEDEWKTWSAHVMGGTHLLAVQVTQPSTSPSEAITSRDVWKHDRGYTSVVPSPLAYDGILYVIKNGGILTAFDMMTGEVVKMGRVPGAIGGYSASPVAAEGKVFLANEDGQVAVLKAAREWEPLAVNDLGEGVYATPALSDGRVYIRTTDALYAFGAR